MVDKLPTSVHQQEFWRDAVLKGFGLRITTNGTKSAFSNNELMDVCAVRVISRFGELTCEQARLHAQWTY